MKLSSVKVNLIYNGIRTFMSLIFPLVTFPYASRIILADGIGKVDFSRTLVSYFLIIAMLGIPTYATREVARIRDNKDKLSKFCHEIMFINLISSAISYILFFMVLFSSSKVYSDRNLFIVMSIGIILNPAGMEWLYEGLEKYEYITKRTILFQVITIILMLLLIKNKSDYMLYGFLIVLSSFGSNVLNLINSHKYISYKLYGRYEIFKHIKPISTMFITILVMSFYGQLNIIMLGFLKSNNDVGLYTSSMKFIQITLSVISSVNTTLLPRLSYHFEKNNLLQIKKMLNNSLVVIILFTLPSAIGMFLLSDQIIFLLGGTAFQDASLSLKILSPVIFFTSINGFIAYQILIPSGREKYFLYSISFGTLVNTLLSIFLIYNYSFVGAAITKLIVEVAIFIALNVFCKKYMDYILITKYLKSVTISCLVVVLIIISLKIIIVNKLMLVLLAVPLSTIGYIVILFLLDAPIVLQVVFYIKNKLQNVITKKQIPINEK